jgi:hypothetical protein
MAVRFDASGDFLKLVQSNLLSELPATNFSCCAWVKRKVDTGQGTTHMYGKISQTGGNGEIYCGADLGGDLIEADELGAGVADTHIVPGPSYTIDTWFFYLYARTTASRSLYYGTEAGGTLTKTTNTDTRTFTDNTNGFGEFWIGNDPFNENWNGEMAAVRLWNVKLSDAEADAEWRSLAAVRTSGLRGDWRLTAAASATTDSSGNSLTLTLGGTLADATNPTPPSAGTKLILIPGR